MKRDNSEQLGDVIKRYLKAFRLDDRYFLAAIKAEWGNLMGPMIVNQTESFFFRNGKLTIRLNSSVLRQELSFGKDKIKTALNEAIGEDRIEVVEIR